MDTNITSSHLTYAQHAKLNETRLALEALVKRQKRQAYEARLQAAGRGLKKHQKTIRSKIIVLLGASLISVLILLFQREDHLKATFEMVQPDRISVLYLQLLMNKDPKDSHLRLMLARQHTKLGDLQNARLILEPLIPEHNLEATEAKLMMLGIDKESYFALADSDPNKAYELDKLRNKIGIIADEPMPVGLMPTVIQISLELGQPALAAKLYERWAGLDEQHYLEHIQDAGRWYVAAGKPMKAAELYKIAGASTRDVNQARQLALLTIKAMLAADKTPLTLAYVNEYLKKFPNDAEILDEAIKLSLAVNDQKQAQAWGELRLALNPGKPEEISKQVDLALASGDLDAAWSLQEKLLTLMPNDVDVHKRGAQIAEWSERLETALVHWAWIAGHNIDDEAALENALKLADGLKSGDITLSILSSLSGKRAFSSTEFNYLINAASNKDYTDKSIGLLQAYLVRYPTEQGAWETLASVQENAHQFKNALATWGYIGGHFGQSLKVVVHQAGLLKRTGQAQLALAKLAHNQKRASVNDTEFWRLYGDLSWESKHKDNALMAYKILWDSSPKDMLAAERLIQLLRDKAQGNESVAVAYKAYRRFNQPRWLLLAMDAASQFRLWGKLGQYMQIAQANKKQFERLEMYWLIHAQYNIHHQNQRQAMADYRRAHTINPASKIAKEGELWTLIDLQNQVVGRLNTVSQQFSTSLESECVYPTSFKASICPKTR